MTAFSNFLLLVMAEPAANESTGFGEFSLRVGLGMGALVIFIIVCCVAWRTLPALRNIIPEFLDKKSSARSASPLSDLNAKPRSNSMRDNRK